MSFLHIFIECYYAKHCWYSSIIGYCHGPSTSFADWLLNALEKKKTVWKVRKLLPWLSGNFGEIVMLLFGRAEVLQLWSSYMQACRFYKAGNWHKKKGGVKASEGAQTRVEVK